MKHPAKLTAREKAEQNLIPQVYDSKTFQDVWEEIRPLLAVSAEVSKGMISLQSIEYVLKTEAAVAFTTVRNSAVELVIVCQLVDYDSYRAARIIACAGKNLAGASKFLDVVEEWAVASGAVEIEGWCRPLMARLTRRLGWQTKFICVSRDLRRKLQ